MLIPLLQLAVVAWLPGAVLFRLPVARREARASLDPEERLFWAVILSVSISASIALALAAARMYSLERLLLADGILALALAAAVRFRLRLQGARRPGLSALLPLALVALGLWRFFPPAEYVIGGKDPGVYINEGIQIAQRARLLVEDPVVASVPPFARDLFFPSHERPDYYGVRFMGFFIRSPDTGTVVGQFPHLFPASIAIGYGVDGLTGARRTVGWWAILGVLALYFLGARLVGRTAAWAAAALLTLHVIQVWFARYPNAEVVMQALLLAAILASSRGHADDDPFFAPVAGGLLGLLLFLRFDTVLGIGGVGAGLLLGTLAGGRVRASFVGTGLAVAALAAVYMRGPMQAYVTLPIVYLTSLRAWQYLAIGLAAVLAAWLLAARARGWKLSPRGASWIPTGIVLVLVGSALYALYFREPGGRLAAHDAYALRTFTGYYLTLPALIAALLGYALWARHAFWRAPELFTTVAIFGLTFFYKIRIVPDHFWMARRFLPVILPGALLFACAAALAPGARRSSTRRLGGVIGLVFVGLLGLQYARASRPLLAHVEYAGVIPHLEKLAAGLAPDDLLIVEGRDAGTDLHTLGLPLAYIYDRPVLILQTPLPDKVMFGTFLDWARTRYRRVLFMGGGGTDLLSERWGARVVAADRLRVPEYDEPGYEYPRGPRIKQFDYTIFELTAPSGTWNEAVDLDIGNQDDLNVLRFHAKEETEGRSIRWSRNVSYVLVPGIRADYRTVTLWMSNGGRPAAAPTADVRVDLQGTRLGEVRVGQGFQPYVLPIPPGLAASLAARAQPVQLRLETEPWVPELVIGTPDDRALGVMVDRVAVK
ncbi:MAG TPA: hypothetical protein VD833_18585 [Vicinamibacterales bacterium]|nr:hypothetical protein [Vicinamibacterales bacterium]